MERENDGGFDSCEFGNRPGSHWHRSEKWRGGFASWQAILQGTVTGGGTADVTVFWGPADGGTTPANWVHKQVLKEVKSDTPFSITAEPLVFGVTYH